MQNLTNLQKLPLLKKDLLVYDSINPYQTVAWVGKKNTLAYTKHIRLATVMCHIKAVPVVK